MTKLPNITIHLKNIIFFLLCFTGIVLLCSFGIIPRHFELLSFHSSIPQLENKVREQAELAQMHAIIDNEQKEHLSETSLPQFRVTPLNKEQSDQILPDFESIAEKSKLKIISLSPKLRKAGNYKMLLVTANIQGEFANIRSFLKELLTLQYVEQINTIEIEPNGNKLHCNLTYTINLS